MSEDSTSHLDADESATKRINSQDTRPDTASDAETEPQSHVASPDPRDEVTVDAPSFRAPTPQPPARRARIDALLPGATIDDFEIIRMLGRGAFGMVYLARQLSLDREVALKISPNRGSEGRTMARLEHQNIVQVFSEKVVDETDQRLLCMQLVPGVGLDRVIGLLHSEGRGARSEERDEDSSILDPPSSILTWTGNDLLNAIDHSASLPAVLDPAALRDREALAEMDAVEATAWIGGRLAEALDYAHRQGVLHRDIKPANILMSPYGRPLLADFNISSRATAELDEEETFGGTLAYMAPEHLDAFNPADRTPPETVTERADLYSLGIVLHQLLAGGLPFTLTDENLPMPGLLRKLADQRRRERPACRAGDPNARKTLEQTICRCLEPEPADRFASGGELARQLDGCRRLRQAERRLPTLRSAPKTLVERPFFWLLVLLVLPQLVASAINIMYNASQIVGRLTEAQQSLFVRLVVGYNLIVYPIALALFAWALWPVWKTWRAMCGAGPVDALRVAAARQQALRLPLWVAGLTAFGWFTGGLLFPAVIAWRAGPLPASAAFHFVVSFALSGLIALAYSFCGVQYVVLRALYPRLWHDVRDFEATARRELAPMATRANSIQLLAGSIPLVAAVLMLTLGGDETRAFRGMVTALIVAGMFGYQMAMRVTRSLTGTVAALIGGVRSEE
jgi:eukaryotic-like serine/threonine-protein kinase